MISIQNKAIKTKRGLGINFKNKVINHTDINGDYKYLYDWYKIEEGISIDIVLEVINLINNNYTEREIINFLSKSKNTFSKNNYDKYLDFRKTNKSDSNSDLYYQLVYGSSWENEKMIRTNDKNNVYDPIYISKRDNISNQEALKSINEYKSNKATNLDNFIKNHGEEKGESMFKKFQETSKHTLDKYIKLYGKIEGHLKWKEYTNKKSETSAFNKNFWIEKGLSEKEAVDKVKYISDNSSLVYFRRICNSEEEAIEKFVKLNKLKSVNIGGASKESLLYFDLLYKRLIKSNIDNNKIYYGVDNKFEYLISYGKNHYIYDFTITNPKLIIEYHGQKFHPNKKIMSNLEWDNWESVYDKKSADDMYQKDQHKKQVAIDNGFKYLEIWSNDTYEDNWCKINEFLEENLKIKIEN